MSWVGWLVTYGLSLLCLIGIGCPIAIALGLVAVGGTIARNGWNLVSTFGDILWNNGNSFTLVAIPMFILMGEIILHTGLSTRFYKGLSLLLGRASGGLAYANIVGCAMFSAISGSSVATGITMGQVALPELRSRGYNLRLATGSLAAGGTLGIMIPPSVPLIIYGVAVQSSILDLFMAGVIPGLTLTALFMIWTKISILIHPGWVPATSMASRTWKEIGMAVVDCLPFGGLIILVLGSLYMGVVTPTEAGGFGALAAIIIGILFRALNFRRFVDALVATAITTSVVYYIIVSGALLAFAIVDAGIARGVSNAVVELNLSPLQFFLILCCVYLVLGMLIEGVSMMLLTIPVLYPSIIALGFDPIWFGIILVLFIEIGALTPPMGLNLFAITSVASDLNLKIVIRGSFPYLIMMFVAMALFYMFPQLVLWLPHTLH